jgi:hypothetical protein
LVVALDRTPPSAFLQTKRKTPTFRSVGVFQFAEDYFVAGAAGPGTGGCVSTLASQELGSFFR